MFTNSYWTPDGDLDDNLKANDAPQHISFGTYIHHNPSDHYPVFMKVRMLGEETKQYLHIAFESCGIMKNNCWFVFYFEKDCNFAL